LAPAEAATSKGAAVEAGGDSGGRAKRDRRGRRGERGERTAPGGVFFQ
jgi:hypothetical protein